MSVNVQIKIRLLPIQGGIPEAGMPSGIWAASGSLAGDASGGSASIVFGFGGGGGVAGIKTGLLYSLEKLDMENGSGVAQVSDILVQNFGLDNKIQNRRTWALELITTTTTGRVTARPRDRDAIKDFLGQQFGNITQAGLTLRIDNVNGVTTSASVAGYMWDPVSKRTTGGLRRPIGPFPF